MTDAKPKRSQKFKSMSDHLQFFNKTLNQKALQSHMPVKTDSAFFEKLSHHKRTNISYVNFVKNKGRDNKMYHLSDGYNLNPKEDRTHFQEALAIQLAMKEHEYKELQINVTRDAQAAAEAARNTAS